MATDSSSIIEELEKCEEIFILYSGFTHLPFIECDDETFDDQVYIFTTQEMTQRFAHPYTLDKILLQAVNIKQKMIHGFLQSLFLYGVNAVMVQMEGAPIRVQLADVMEKPDLEKLANETLPRANPNLQLTAIYFMQELMRPVERNNKEKKHLHELEADMAHYLLSSNFIVTFDVSEIEGRWNPKDPNQKLKVPLVKTKSGKSYQPVYTDLGELQRFNAKNTGVRLEMTAVPYEKLTSFLVEQSEGFVFNPAGFNLILTRAQLEQMQKRYTEAE